MTWRRVALAAVAVALATGYAVRAPLLERAGRYLVVEDPPQQADAILVLSGSFPDRILEAVSLYRDGLAPRIVLCRETENPGFRRLDELGVVLPRGHERNREVAVQLGVPPEAISVVDRWGASTFGEARRTLEHARDRGYRRILLVTSKYHTQRASRIYRHLAGDAVEIISRPSRYDDYDPSRWWRERTTLRRIVIEYQKLLLFVLHDRRSVEPIAEARAEREP